MGLKTAITLAASAARTSSGEGSPVDLGSKTTARLRLDVTVVAGTTPSLAVTVETSLDGLGGWRLVGTFPTVSAVGLQSLSVPGCDKFVRAKWTIAGSSPSFTFSVAGDAVLVYATPTDLTKLSVGAGALGGVGAADQDEAIEGASDVADKYLAARYTLPLTSWRDDLRRDVCNIATYDLMSVRGYNPEGGFDENIRLRYEDAMRSLREVAAGGASYAGIVDSTPTVEDGGIAVYTEAKRGW